MGRPDPRQHYPEDYTEASSNGPPGPGEVRYYWLRLGPYPFVMDALEPLAQIHDFKPGAWDGVDVVEVRGAPKTTCLALRLTREQYDRIVRELQEGLGL